MRTYFDHEKVNVYQVALEFNRWVGELLASIDAKAAAKDQLDRAATSIPLNIAEENGKFFRRDQARFCDIARGSALEAAASLDVLVSRKLTTQAQVVPAKEQLVQIVNMLIGLLKGLATISNLELRLCAKERIHRSASSKSRSKRKSKK
jgi:four helix bundle protein